MSAVHAEVLISAAEAGEGVRAVRIVRAGEALPDGVVAWAAAQDFTGKAGQLLLTPGADGGVGQAMFGAGERFDPMSSRALAARLPAGVWRLENVEGEEAAQAALAFALGSYLFDRDKARPERGRARLAAPEGVDVEAVLRIAAACALAREMVDTPAADMGPLQIETVAREIAEEARAEIAVTEGEALLEANYPAVHAVGRAAAPHRQPRLIEIGWKLEQTELPLVALVGKGVVFDTGGLDIKPAAGMRNMKKDMGGAAHALALGRLIETAVSADSFRPGDILRTRKGLTVEVGNTDAAGRLILADALPRAGEHRPDLTLDFATLTGAARIALGPELPPLFTDDEALAAGLLEAAAAVRDPLWRMPLWGGYRGALEADIADLRNDPAGWAQAGSVTAALFLQRFAPETGAWAHMDIFAWNPRGRPGWPEGGEAQAIRACFRYLQDHFGEKSEGR